MITGALAPIYLKRIFLPQLWPATGLDAFTSAPLKEIFMPRFSIFRMWGPKLQVIRGWPGLRLAGVFRPSNQAVLRDGDTDLGSGGPLLLPGQRLIGGGKQGRYYVLDADTMHLTQDTVSPDPARIGEGFQAFRNTWHPKLTEADYATGEIPGPNIHAGPVFWEGTNFVYKMAEKDYLKAFHYDPVSRVVWQDPNAR
jgi:hypothetical protein